MKCRPQTHLLTSLPVLSTVTPANGWQRRLEKQQKFSASQPMPVACYRYCQALTDLLQEQVYSLAFGKILQESQWYLYLPSSPFFIDCIPRPLPQMPLNFLHWSLVPYPLSLSFKASQTFSLLQIYALPSMELIFDHSPVTEGLATLSGDPGAESLLANGSAEQTVEVEGESEGFNARPVVVELRMECFAHGSERLQGDDARHALCTCLWLVQSYSLTSRISTTPARVLFHLNIALLIHCGASMPCTVLDFLRPVSKAPKFSKPLKL